MSEFLSAAVASGEPRRSVLNQRLRALRDRSPARSIANDPKLILAFFLALHTIVFGAVAVLAAPTLPLDVVELLAWARDPQWAYYKQPPLPAWILGGVMALTGHAKWAAALVGPLMTTLALWLVWQLARRVVDPTRALIAILALEGVIYFNVTSIEFNHNVVQLPLWALIALFGHRAYRSGGLANWLMLGAAASLGLLGKYSTALLLVVLLGAFLADKSGRQHFATKGPWISMIAALGLLSPHFIGLQKLHFAPFDYVAERSSAPNVWLSYRFLLEFLTAQGIDVLAAIMLLLAVLVGGQKDGDFQLAGASRAVAASDRRFLWIIAIGPLLLTLAISAAFGVRLHSMWGAPMWDFFTIAAVASTAQRSIDASSLQRFVLCWSVVFTLAMIVGAAPSVVGPYLTHNGGRAHFPARAMSCALARGWNADIGNRPIGIVIGDSWVGGLVSVYLPDHPSLMIDGEPKKSPWINSERLKREGAILIWAISPKQFYAAPQRMLHEFASARLQPPLTLAFDTAATVAPARIGWAILPPERRDADTLGGFDDKAFLADCAGTKSVADKRHG